MTSIDDLYRHIIYTDDTCVNFLKQKSALLKQEFCEKVNNVSNELCGGVLKKYHKNSRKLVALHKYNKYVQNIL